MDLGNSSTLSGEIILTFFMPLFFFISGFFAFKDENKWDLGYCGRYLTNKIKTLVICPIIFYALFHFSRNENPIGWIQHGFQEYWFVNALFIMSLVYLSLIIVSRLIHQKIAAQGMVVMAILSLGCMATHILPTDYTIFQVSEIANACYFFQFFSIGIICKKYHAKFLSIITHNALYSICLIIYIISILYNHANININLLTLVINSFILQYTATFLVVSIFLRNKDVFERNNIVSKWICFTGRRTLDIYMMHYFFIPTLPILGIWLLPNTMILFQLLIPGTIAVAITVICLLISNCIRISSFLADWLFGVKPKAMTQEP